MNSTVKAALITGGFSVVAAIAGGAASRTDWFEQYVANNPLPKLEGTRFESTWANIVNNKRKEYREVITITSEKRGRIYGNVKMDETPHLKWDIEGDYDGRFLRIFYHASNDSQNKFFLERGCYFFERQGDGSFKGYSVGYDGRQGKVAVDEHVVRPI